MGISLSLSLFFVNFTFTLKKVLIFIYGCSLFMILLQFALTPLDMNDLFECQISMCKVVNNSVLNLMLVFLFYILT